MWKVPALVLGCAVLPASLPAQNTTSISGHVTDAARTAIEAAQVSVRNVETGAERNLSTGSGGQYEAPGLEVGRYELVAAKQGFQTAAKTGIVLVVGQHAEVNFELQVGELKQIVSVEEPLPVVSVTTEPTSGLVNERQVKELPLNGRSYDELMTLNPGVVNYTAQCGRRGQFELGGRQHVFGLGAAAAGVAVSSKRD